MYWHIRDKWAVGRGFAIISWVYDGLLYLDYFLDL